MSPPRIPLRVRLLGKTFVDPQGPCPIDESPCWIWTGSRNRGGYGHIGINRVPARTHRVAYELLRGPIPDGLQLDHLCRNRACLNPAHLEPVTNWENQLRGDTSRAANAAKTHCGRGHEFDLLNTYFDPLGKRVCRICRRAAGRRYYGKKKVAR
jgi:hypothetical protein